MRASALRTTALATVMIAAFAVTDAVWAQDDPQADLLKRIEMLENQLTDLKGLIQATSEKATQAEEKAVAAEAKAETVTIKPVAYQGKLPDTTWHLAGYAETGLNFSNGDESSTFVSGKFNPGFHFQYKDLFMFEAELEFETEDGETEVALEYSQIDIFLHDNATLVIGKYLSPIGQFQERLHPGWINRAGSAPAGFGHDGVQPISDVGIQLRGGVPLGAMKATYVLAIGNGPRMGHEGGVALEGFGEDDNNNKSLGGRLAFFPMPQLELGGSYLTAKIDGLEGTGLLEPSRADFELWGLDGAYTKGPWDVRFEYLRSTRSELFSAHEEGEEVELLEKQTLKAWYAQAAYRLSSVSDNLHIGRLEPVVRYGQFRAEGNHELEEMTQDNFYVGLNYWMAPSFVLRGGYEVKDFRDPDAENDKIFQLEAVYGF